MVPLPRRRRQRLGADSSGTLSVRVQRGLTSASWRSSPKNSRAVSSQVGRSAARRSARRQPVGPCSGRLRPGAGARRRGPQHRRARAPDPPGRGRPGEAGCRRAIPRPAGRRPSPRRRRCRRARGSWGARRRRRNGREERPHPRADRSVHDHPADQVGPSQAGADTGLVAAVDVGAPDQMQRRQLGRQPREGIEQIECALAVDPVPHAEDGGPPTLPQVCRWSVRWVSHVAAGRNHHRAEPWHRRSANVVAGQHDEVTAAVERAVESRLDPAPGRPVVDAAWRLMEHGGQRARRPQAGATGRRTRPRCCRSPPCRRATPAGVPVAPAARREGMASAGTETRSRCASCRGASSAMRRW